VTSVAPLHRTLEQELQALLRGASLECLVCGEFVLHRAGMITCPECSSSLRAGREIEEAQRQFDTQAG
jgi:Zn finger protein HypA/HybF involved in hydrogenase expression